MASDSRQVLDYSELWNEASTSAAQPNVNKTNVSKLIKQGESSSTTKSTPVAWSNDGTPQTASSARKLRKLLKTISVGRIEEAEKELSTMGAAKKNFEIQRALVMAKKMKSEGGFEDGDEEESLQYQENGDDLQMDEEQDADMTEISFNWQGNSNRHGQDEGRQLTHAEIWDDSALVDAWNAAEEEYKLFHARRTAQEEVAKKQQSVDVEEELEQPPKKKSALWHESPAKGSVAAIAAKNTLIQQENIKRELEARKKRARALLARVAGDEEQEKSQESTPVEVQSNGVARKKFKGTTPPSSSLSGNLAWHSACATVSKTPNAIGRVNEETSTSIPANNATTPQSTSTSTAAAEGEEIFQNLAMAWYYAGYYQAMATAWSAGKGEAK